MPVDHAERDAPDGGIEEPGPGTDGGGDRDAGRGGVEAAPPLRSMLFVPGDSDRKLAKSESAGADALILDLEDSVDPARKGYARGLVAEYLARPRSPRSSSLWVRINALGDPDARKDLECLMPAPPDGVVLPKPDGPDDVLRLGRRLEDLERRCGAALGATRIMPIATETPAGVFAAGGYRRCGARLAAIGWGAEDLSVALGASTNVDEHGDWLPPYQLARSLCLLAAAAAGVRAIDTVHTAFRDADGLIRSSAAAQRDGFAGKLAVHPEQVEILNRMFSPDAAAIAYARRVVDAFEASAGLGVVALDGRMLDRPHLMRARRTLRLAGELEARRRQ